MCNREILEVIVEEVGKEKAAEFCRLVSFWEEKLGIDFVELLGEDFEVWEGWDEQKEILELDKIKELCVTEKS